MTLFAGRIEYFEETNVPIYEYECANCGHTLEVIQKISDKPLTECPSCHATRLRKLVSAAAFQLKGTGWYVTDFKDKKKAPESTGTKSPDEKSKKTESTPGVSGETGKTAAKKTTTSGD